MKKIVLIGDSIRMGYDKYVKEALADVAEVYYPEENCRFAEYTLRFAHEWKSRGKWPDDIDLVHWNVGLWDVCEIFGDEPLTPIEFYKNLIKRIDKRLRLIFPGARMVFALSTAVVEKKYGPSFKRHNAVIESYNRAAAEALSDTDTVINDLYSVTVDCPDECKSDMTHFNTPAGAARVGGKVLSVICNELGISASEVAIEGFELEKYTKENIGQ